MANPIETISVSRFKATCLAVLQRVKRTGKPVLITRFGEPVAELVPPSPQASKSDWLVSMEGRAQLLGADQALIKAKPCPILVAA